MGMAIPLGIAFQGHVTTMMLRNNGFLPSRQRKYVSAVTEYVHAATGGETR
jgi:hypothetical protein